LTFASRVRGPVGSERQIRSARQEQRIDRWLWHARVVRTRNAAAALAGSGYVRVNGARILVPSRLVRSGDVITVALHHAVRVLKVRGFVERRGKAGTVSTLYEDLTAGIDEAARAAQLARQNALR
jgi:ribosome-associated heat shock protein Hsp15